MSDIFREIDEELRRDNLAKLWRRYSSYIIALVVAVVVATGAAVGWRQYQAGQRQAEGVHYADAMALARQGKDQAAADAFAEIGRNAGGGYGVLARFEAAALRAKSGDTDAAIKLYRALGEDGSVETVYRDLARLLAAEYQLDKGDSKAIIEQVAPLTSADNPWHPMALEVTALAQLKSGDKTAARTTYQRLADDLTAPRGLRARAAEMVAALPPQASS